MQKIQFAIIGCGRAAAIHAAQIGQYGQLIAVCDTNLVKGKAFAAIHGVPFYEDYTALLKQETNITVVVICTPNGLHAAQAIAAMKRGYHVLVEKPMALNLKDARKMMAVAESTGRQLFTVMQNRFNPPVVALKQALDKGRLGKLYSVQLNCFWNRNAAYYKNNWHGTRELDGGILFTQFSHFIDVLIWFFGPVQQVKSVLKNAAHQGQIALEDQGAVLLEWKNGLIGTLHYSVNSFSKNREGSLTVLGEKGMVKIGGEYLNLLEYAHLERGTISLKKEAAPANQYGTYQGSMGNHGQVYKSLVASLQKGEPYYTSAANAKDTIELIQQIMKSSS